MSRRPSSRRSRLAPGKRDRRRPSEGKPVGVAQHTRSEAAVPPLTETRTHRCPVCRNAVSLTPRGFLHKHTDLFGAPCTNKATGERIDLDEIPPVIVPSAPAYPDEPEENVAERVSTPRTPRASGTPSRLDVGSSCQDCGKWIPGERRLCGRCYALGGNA